MNGCYHSLAFTEPRVDVTFLYFAEYMDLDNNGLRGSIPTELSRLVQLRVASLRFNHLSGTIPDSLCESQDRFFNNLRQPAVIHVDCGVVCDCCRFPPTCKN